MTVHYTQTETLNKCTIVHYTQTETLNKCTTVHYTQTETLSYMHDSTLHTDRDIKLHARQYITHRQRH